MQKAQGDISPHASDSAVNGGAVIHEDGSVTHRDSVVSKSTTLVEGQGNVADDDASIRGVREIPADVESPTSSTAEEEEEEEVAEGIPTIRISTESNREKEKQANGKDDAKQTGMTEVPGSALEKPIQAAAGEDKEAGGTQEPPAPNAAQEPFSFSNKRLCERWLDNLFMVLYEVNSQDL